MVTTVLAMMVIDGKLFVQIKMTFGYVKMPFVFNMLIQANICIWVATHMVDQFMAKKKSVVIRIQIIKIYGKSMLVFIFDHHLNHYRRLETTVKMHVRKQKLIISTMNFKSNIEKNVFFLFLSFFFVIIGSILVSSSVLNRDQA